MTHKEKKLTSELLDIASDDFSNNGCNDVPEEFYADWTIEERKNFVKEYHEWNGDAYEYDPEYLDLPDFALMSFMADKLLKDKE